MLAKEESFENRRRAQKLAAERLATTDTAATKARKQASASSTLDAAATTTAAATAMLLPTSNSVPSIRSVSPIRQRVKNAAAVSPWSRQSLRDGLGFLGLGLLSGLRGTCLVLERLARAMDVQELEMRAENAR